MNFLELKPLVADLLPAMVEFDQLCLGGLWTLEGYRRELESPNSDLIILQAVDDRQNNWQPDRQDKILAMGCLWAIADEAHITLLAVHPQYRQQGLGQLVLHKLLTLARQRELRWATLEVRVSNQAAILLYQKFGFETVGQRRRYYQDTGEDALILWAKNLQHSSYGQTLREWQKQIDDRLQQFNWKLKKSAALGCSS
ncbi:MAG: ribosomal protein S18-alanine N-acetyltransferase [Elainellaceae cyanobacterium]